MFSKNALSSVTGTVTSSGIQKVKLVPPKLSERATRPALRVIVVGLVVRLLVSTKKLTVAFADFLEEGKYPIFRARETTFSRQCGTINENFVRHHVGVVRSDVSIIC